MFTGLITDVGKLLEINNARLRMASSYVFESIDIGASIACSGACLTVIDKGNLEEPYKTWFEVDVSQETVSKTTINTWQVGKRINFERAMKVGDELGGHLVSGHVDGVATVIDCQDHKGNTDVLIESPCSLMPFIASKGSVTLDGVSLTINEVIKNTFRITLIPHTKAHTTLGEAHPQGQINLEIDMMARYAARFIECQRS